MAKKREYDPIAAMELSRAQAEMPPPQPKQPWRLVYYIGKKRREMLLTTRQVRPALSLMKRKGLRHSLVLRKGWYLKDGIMHSPEPKGRPEDGQMWCCYCRAWRYFAVPSSKIANGAYHEQNIRICFWCRISEKDYYIRWHNLLMQKDLAGVKTRRGRRRVTRRR